MKSCRGIGAALTEEEMRAWEQEHRSLLTFWLVMANIKSWT